MIATVDCSGSMRSRRRGVRPIGASVEQLLDLPCSDCSGRRGSPRTSAGPGRGDPEHPRACAVQPLGQALGGLHAEPVHEQLLGELAVCLELGHQLGHLVADGHRLEGDDVELAGGCLREVRRASTRAGRSRRGRCGRPGLAGEDEARCSTRRSWSSGSSTTMSLPSRVAGEVAEQRARVQVGPARATSAPGAGGSPRR